jgi:hypothetical protein
MLDMALLRRGFAVVIAQFRVASAAAQFRKFVGKTLELAAGFQPIRLRV